MSSTNRRTTNEHPYFLFVITNYPYLLQRTQAYQQSNQHWQTQYHREMLIPGVRIHLGNIHPDDHEQLLYNTLRYHLEQIIRSYLRQTYRSLPIYVVFDMSNITPSMEFTIDHLNQIIMDLSDEPSDYNPNHVNNNSSNSTKQKQTNLNEQPQPQQQQASTITNNIPDRQYCLIIFNNRSWSQRLRQRATEVKQHEQQQQQHQQIDPERRNHRTENIADEREPSEIALDNQFIARLRQLMNDYMSHTNRPFPIKYFIDFTN